MKLYSSDVRLLSDEELETFSTEIAEAYEREDHDGFTYWLDDEAGERFWAMHAEQQRRRLARMTPEELAKYKADMAAFSKITLEVMANNIGAVIRVSQDYEQAFSGSKIGDTLHIRTPARYRK